MTPSALPRLGPAAGPSAADPRAAAARQSARDWHLQNPAFITAVLWRAGVIGDGPGDTARVRHYLVEATTIGLHSRMDLTQYVLCSLIAGDSIARLPAFQTEIAGLPEDCDDVMQRVIRAAPHALWLHGATGAAATAAPDIP